MSLHLFLSKHKLLFILPSCSPHLDRETTANTFLVTILVLFIYCFIYSVFTHSTLKNPFPAHFTVAHPVPLHQQMSPVDNLLSYEELVAHTSASSLANLPLSSLPTSSSLSLTSDPLSAQFHPQALLDEIAQLSHQNSLLRAQLHQAKDLGSGVGGSPGSCEQKRLSPCSTGRITPQGVEESRKSNSTGRHSQKIQAADKDKLDHQVRLIIPKQT